MANLILPILKSHLLLLAFAWWVFASIVSLEAAPAVASSQVVSCYSLQLLIDFDCLDGASVDKATGTITLFGRRANPKYLLHVAYFDYLATALEYKSPSFSLEATQGFVRSVERASQSRNDAVMKVLTHPFILKGDKVWLTESGAWLLQQGGVEATLGLTHRQTLAKMLRAANHPDAAEIMDRMQACVDAKGDTQAAWVDLYEALGISGAYQDISNRASVGRITQEQARDEANTLYLRAMAEELGVQATRYTDSYAGRREQGASPDEAMKKLEYGELLTDANALFEKTVEEIFKDTPRIDVPSWIGNSVGEESIPRVKPVFTDLPQSSWLARTAFDADILCKTLSIESNPRLTALIPSYRTERQFLSETGRLKGGLLEFHRFGIKSGAFDMVESSDGNSLWFRRTPMVFDMVRISISENGETTDIDDPVLSEYAAELSKLYDPLARVFPTLQKLREAQKIIAIANWLDRQGIKVTLPKQGRLSWTPPESVPSVMVAHVTVKAGQLNTTVNGAGGVNLSQNSAWRVSQEPITVPHGERKMDIPVANGTQGTESNLRSRLSTISDKNERVRLEVELAQTLSNRGDPDAAMREMDKALRLDSNRDILWLLVAVAHQRNGDLQGSKQALAEYSTRVPENIAAKKALVDISNEISRHSASSRGRVEPFEQNGPIAKAFYSSDERAPELIDVQFPPFKFSLPPAPVPPDFVALHPEIQSLQVRRDALVEEYSRATPEKGKEVRRQIDLVDKETVKKVKSYNVDFDESDNSPSKAK